MKTAWRWLCIPYCALVLASCGGGGGGGSSSGSTTYTGATTQAAISDNNAETICLQALDGGLWADPGLSMPMGVGAEGTGAAGTPTLLSILQVLKEAGGRISAPGTADAGSGASPRVVQTVNDTVYDGQGGYYSYSVSYDTATQAFWGTFQFANYHGDRGAVFSGTISVTGSQTTPTTGEMTFTLGSFSVTQAGATVSAAGTIAMSFGATSESVTVNLVLQNTSTGKTVWIDHYSETMTEGVGYVLFTVDGRIYLHDYGYVDVSTETAIRYDDGASHPSAGILKVTGSGNRFARITVVDSTSYQIEADCNGDGLIDFTASGTWS